MFPPEVTVISFNVGLIVVTVGNRDMLPMELEQNMTMSRIALDGNDVRFDIDFNCSDLGIGMSDFKMAMGMDEVKNQLIAGMFSEMNEGMEVMMKAIIASNKHFCVNFIDRESGESAKIRLTNSELKQLF